MSSAGRTSVAGVVPAAGASRRMGRPKGFLEIGGRTFGQRVVRALTEGGCDPVYVVVAADDPELAVHMRETDATVLENPDPGEGPITSLRLALSRLSDDVEGLVYLPLDHALVEPTHVADLLAAARRTDAPLALPVHEGERGHPAFFRHVLFDELLDPALEGGARTVVHRHLERACLVPSDDVAVITDMDTPEAYERGVRLHAWASGAGGGT